MWNILMSDLLKLLHKKSCNKRGSGGFRGPKGTFLIRWVGSLTRPPTWFMFTAQCSKYVKTKMIIFDQNQLYFITWVLKNFQNEHHCKNGELSNYTELAKRRASPGYVLDRGFGSSGKFVLSRFHLRYSIYSWQVNTPVDCDGGI